MPATFDKKAYAQQIAALDLDSVQDAIFSIDERTYTDLQKRDVLVARRRDLAMPEFENLSQTTIRSEHWRFELRQVQKPYTPAIIERSQEEGRFQDVWRYIVEAHPEFLSISKEHLMAILSELKLSKEDQALFLAGVLKDATPSVTAKRP